MEAIIAYLSDMPTEHRSIVLFGGLAFFFLFENAVPLFRDNYNKWKHAGLNIFFTITTVVVNLVPAAILYTLSNWAVEHNFGLIQWIEMPGLVQMIVGLLLLDLVGAWLAHFTEHRVKFMWQFHVVHHTDKHVDTTTANRHHPGESVIRFLFTTFAVMLVGAPVWLILLYQSCSVILSQFNHSNLKMPEWLDKALRTVICTPNMHRVHHHYRQPYSDTNFGNIFSFWDRIFGTYAVVDNRKLIYGVDTYMETSEVDNVGNLLKIPFSGYRKEIEYDQEEKL